MREKFRILTSAERWVAGVHPDCNVFSVDSAVCIAGQIGGISRQTLLKAVAVGSLHAYDWANDWDFLEGCGGGSV
jgi:hypothetical protein